MKQLSKVALLLLLAAIPLGLRAQEQQRVNLMFPSDLPRERCLSWYQTQFQAGDVTVRMPEGMVTRMVTGEAYLAGYQCSGFARAFQFSFSRPVAGLQFKISMPGEGYSVYADGSFIFGGQRDRVHTIIVPSPVRVIRVERNGPSGPWWGWGAYIWDMSFARSSFSQFNFDLDPTVPQKVLIHKYNADDTNYPPNQIQDREVIIKGKITDDTGAPAPNQQVFFRLTDPPDSAPYAHPIAKDNDNLDRDEPRLLTSIGSSGFGQTVSARSDSAGNVALTLRVTDHVSGDNYRLMASTNEDFICGTGCPASATYTAWKRSYLQVHRMFRTGSYLTTRVTPGSMEVAVQTPRAFRRLALPFRAVLMHGPGYNSNNRTFWNEEVTVVGRVDNRLVFERAVLFDYDGPETVHTVRRPYLADAIAVVTGNADADFFMTDFKALDDAFAGAFTEYVFLTRRDTEREVTNDQRVIECTDAYVPSDRRIGETPNGQDPLAYRRHEEFLARKWIRGADGTGKFLTAAPNVQAFLSCDRLYEGTKMGLTSVASGYNDTWFATTTADDSQEAEAIVHEAAHQWKVNPAPQKATGHCDIALGAQKAFGTNFPCTMTYGTAALEKPHVGFHFVEHPAGTGVYDSEYLTIRQKAEPIPQFQALERED
jgi:hypothetical protein